MSSPHWMPFSSMKNARATESGRRSSPLVKTSANRNSFQARMKEYIATATKAGRAIGSTISQRSCGTEHPSTIAASSISIGILSKKPLSSQIATGKVTIR